MKTVALETSDGHFGGEERRRLTVAEVGGGLLIRDCATCVRDLLACIDGD